jgi:hypothetical protein
MCYGSYNGPELAALVQRDGFMEGEIVFLFVLFGRREFFGPCGIYALQLNSFTLVQSSTFAIGDALLHLAVKTRDEAIIKTVMDFDKGETRLLENRWGVTAKDTAARLKLAHMLEKVGPHRCCPTAAAPPLLPHRCCPTAAASPLLPHI